MYLYTKLVAAFIVFVCDMVTLMQCGTDQSINNAALVSISLKGLCPMVRLCYVVGFVIDYGLNHYFAYISLQYSRLMTGMDTYIIRFLENNSDNHTQVKFFDESQGEPAKYLGQGPYNG